jgi:sodium/bile acid cotransporter 7
MVDYVRKRWFLLLLLTALSAGFLQPEEVGFWAQKAPIRYVSAGTLFLTSIGLAGEHILGSARRPAPVLLALLVSLGIGPILGWGVGSALLPEVYQVGLTIALAVPCTLVTAVLWTRFAGGNESVSLLVTLISNSLSLIVTTGWLSVLLEREVSFDRGAMALGLLMFALVPTALAQGLRLYPPIARAADRFRPAASFLGRLFVLLIVVQSAVEARRGIASAGSAWSAEELFRTAAVCWALHAILFAVGYFAGLRFFPRKDAIAVAFSGSQKTLPVGAMLVADYFPTFPLAIVPILFFHAGQLLIDTYLAERLAEQDPGDDLADLSSST